MPGGETKKAMGVPPPYPLAMVVCDSIHRDPGTGKSFLLGTFSVIHADAVPAIHPRMALHIAITNGRGDVPIRVALVDANEEREPIWAAEMEVEFPDPRMVVELSFVLDKITFEQLGEYRFQLFASGQFLMERRVLVLSYKESQGEE